jgi:competence protein ComEC
MNLQQVSPRIVLTLALLGSMACVVTGESLTVASSTRWTMLNVTPAQWQGESHLLEFADGTKVLIDAGEAQDAPPILLPWLQERGINRIDLVVISHFHQDHYGRLRDLISSGIKIGRVAYNLPASRAVADREKPWGMVWEDAQALLQELAASGIPGFTPKAGDQLVDLKATDGATVRLEVVCLYDGVNTPVGPTYVNDTSIVLRLSHGASRVLFTGDLDRKLGTWLAAQPGLDLRADILKVPHHGGEGHAPDEFYDRVAPQVCLVSTSHALWAGPLCARFRAYVKRKQLPFYLTGSDGHVTVDLSRDGFTVKTQGRGTRIFSTAP